MSDATKLTPKVTPKALLSADAVIVGSPAYFGNMSGEVKTFFDNWLRCRRNKNRYLEFS